ncbi:hypothetical protein K474DRAFT_1695531 [Panus rudis PR-1116 ss-1]|nr:hypothetical protein K474DRAFT_1695531 [Panus rudis PR-1116 ss-1]
MSKPKPTQRSIKEFLTRNDASKRASGSGSSSARKRKATDTADEAFNPPSWSKKKAKIKEDALTPSFKEEGASSPSLRGKDVIAMQPPEVKQEPSTPIHRKHTASSPNSSSPGSRGSCSPSNRSLRKRARAAYDHPSSENTGLMKTEKHVYTPDNRIFSLQNPLTLPTPPPTHFPLQKRAVNALTDPVASRNDVHADSIAGPTPTISRVVNQHQLLTPKSPTTEGPFHQFAAEKSKLTSPWDLTLRGSVRQQSNSTREESGDIVPSSQSPNTTPNKKRTSRSSKKFAALGTASSRSCSPPSARPSIRPLQPLVALPPSPSKQWSSPSRPVAIPSSQTQDLGPFFASPKNEKISDFIQSQSQSQSSQNSLHTIPSSQYEEQELSWRNPRARQSSRASMPSMSSPADDSQKPPTEESVSSRMASMWTGDPNSLFRASPSCISGSTSNMGPPKVPEAISVGPIENLNPQMPSSSSQTNDASSSLPDEHALSSQTVPESQSPSRSSSTLGSCSQASLSEAAAPLLWSSADTSSQSQVSLLTSSWLRTPERRYSQVDKYATEGKPISSLFPALLEAKQDRTMTESMYPLAWMDDDDADTATQPELDRDPIESQQSITDSVSPQPIGKHIPYQRDDEDSATEPESDDLPYGRQASTITINPPEPPEMAVNSEVHPSSSKQSHSEDAKGKRRASPIPSPHRRSPLSRKSWQRGSNETDDRFAGSLADITDTPFDVPPDFDENAVETPSDLGSALPTPVREFYDMFQSGKHT